MVVRGVHEGSNMVILLQLFFSLLYLGTIRLSPVSCVPFGYGEYCIEVLFCTEGFFFITPIGWKHAFLHSNRIN